MEIIRKREGDSLNMALTGRLDTTSSPQLEAELRQVMDEIRELTLDLKDLTYVSSAGLRVFLSAQKVMNKRGEMTIRNAQPQIMEIFDVTGFTDILNIEA